VVASPIHQAAHAKGAQNVTITLDLLRPMKTAIAYTRVSTVQQGKSGLGLEAQQAALVRFAEAEGFDLVQTFQEVETGKGADALSRRPQLAAALKAAKKLKSPIIVAKLDRLSRDVHFISGLAL
jgi:DNA invertase Pin-like site-specific DNA recombinase